MGKLIYIAGNEHSGSTLLELMLSSHPRICGLGETHMLIDDQLRAERLPEADVRICTCGKPFTKCPLWSVLLKYMERDHNSNFAARYHHLIQLAQKEFGEKTVIVDSSKYIAPLSKLIEAITSGRLPDFNLFVIHLVKDVRSYIASMKRRYSLNSWQLLSRFKKWYRLNVQLERFIRERGIQHIRIGYEELCFNPRLILAQVCKETDVQFNEQMLNISYATAHIGVGNPMRNHPTKATQIIYDNRWFFEVDILWWYLLCRRIRRYNEKAVYKHIYADRNARLFEPQSM